MPVVGEEQALSGAFQVRNFGEKAASLQVIGGLTKPKVMQFEVCIKKEGCWGWGGRIWERGGTLLFMY